MVPLSPCGRGARGEGCGPHADSASADPASNPAPMAPPEAGGGSIQPIRPGDHDAHREKYRLRFSKTGMLRFVGHQDLLKCWQRLLRRTALPLRVTEGFNPRPALSSPLALGLGIEGLDEPLEFELTTPLPATEVERRVRAQLDPGLGLVSVTRMPRRTAAAAVAVEYRFPVPATHAADAAERLLAALAAPELPIVRKMPGKPDKRVDLRPYLESAEILGPPGDADGSDGAVVFRLAVRPTGTARPEEILDLLGLRPLLEHGVSLVRTRVELASNPMPDAHAPASAAPLEGTAS